MWVSLLCVLDTRHALCNPTRHPITIIIIIIIRASWRSSVMRCSDAVKPSEQLLMLPASKSAWPQLV